MICRWFCAVVLLSLLSVTSQAEEPATPVFQAGFAERDISPKIGMEQPGGYGKSYHQSFHDPCKVRAVLFEQGENRVALVGIDALFIHRDTVKAVRKRIASEIPLAEDAILLAASHSHSSGPMAGVMPGEYDHASPLVQKLAYEYTTCADPEYLKQVEQALVEAVVEAFQKRVPARAGIGSGHEDQVAFNRRFRMRSGLTMTHPGQNNPDILEVAGPTDPEVGVIGVWDENKKFLGCVVNYACHATTNPGGISANYVYYLEQVIRGSLGPDSVVVFLNGASGDVTQVDNLSPHQLRQGEDSARFVGGRIGAEAVKVLLTITPGQLVPIAARTKILQIPRRVPRPERVAESLKIAEKDPAQVDHTEWAFAKEIVLLDAKLQQQPTAEVEVQVVQVGPAVFVTDPAEFFCQFGLDIKQGSPFPFTFPVSLANGCVGYVPTEEALGPRGGGYETRLTSYSNLVPTAGQQMVEAGLELARQLTPGEVPQPAPAPAFRGSPWSYGSVPPELD